MLEPSDVSKHALISLACNALISFATQEATKRRKRAREEPADPVVDRDSRSSENPHRCVRRKVAEAPPAARTVGDATNSSPRVPSPKEASSKQEEANVSDEDDDDDAHRFTRIEKEKFTEKEGVAVAALIELSLEERALPSE